MKALKKGSRRVVPAGTPRADRLAGVVLLGLFAAAAVVGIVFFRSDLGLGIFSEGMRMLRFP